MTKVLSTGGQEPSVSGFDSHLLDKNTTGCGLTAKSPALGAGHHPGSNPGTPTKEY